MKSQHASRPFCHIMYMNTLIEKNLQLQSWLTKKETRTSNVYVINWKMKDTVTFGIMNNIREYVELVQLMDSLGNLNNEVSVVKMWIFNSN